MDKKANLLSDKAKQIADIEMPEIMEKTLLASFETIGGILKSKPNELMSSLTNIAQRIIAGQKIESVIIEYEQLRKKGRIPKGYSTSLQSKYTFIELLDFLETAIPDEDRFQVLKKIFLVTASEEKSARNSVKPQQFMKIIKMLPSGAVLIMLSAYKISNSNSIDDIDQSNSDESAWRLEIAKDSGLEYQELVANFEPVLIDNRIITKPLYSDGSGVRLGMHFRLTDFGYEICSFIDHYEVLQK